MMVASARDQAKKLVARRTRSWSAGFAAMMLLSGCASVPIPKPDAPLPEHWQHAKIRTGAPQPNYRDWWQAMDDPALDQVIDLSLRANPNLEAAIERLRAARAIYTHSDAPYKPSLSVGSGDPVDPDARTSYFQLGFDARWELPLFGRGKANRAVAKGHLDSAAANIRDVRVSLVAEVVKDWVRLRAAQQRSDVLQQMLALQDQRINLSQVSVHLGLASPALTANARSRRSDLQVKQRQTRHEIVAAAQQLALLTGRDEPESAWLNTGSLPTLHGYKRVSVPADLLNTRPGIALARAKVIHAAGQLGLARADRYPSIGLDASLVASTSLTGSNASGVSGIGSFGPVIDMPLFDWGLRKARAHAKDHLLKAALFDYRDAVLQGVADVEIRLDDLQSTAAQLQTRSTYLQHQTQAVAHARTRHKLGLGSQAQLVASQVATGQARLQQIQAGAAHDLAYVALYKALGGASNSRINSAGH
ncbi:MAG: efflux transporter outer membrane subunit [Salinisphaera sp.]|jgi:multidrug efflux system outer membrane protein|nr:efflux transporter outer membrane subunit [Salinisphaera sp.]